MMKKQLLAGIVLLATLLGVRPATAQLIGGGQQAVPIADIVYVIDRSSSIGSTKYRKMLEAAADSIGTVIPANASYRVSVVVFADNGVLALPFTEADHPMLPALIEGVHTAYPAGGGTDVESGLANARTAFGQDPSAAFLNQVVLLTDKAEECAYREANAIRFNHEARVSVGWLVGSSGDCDDLQTVFDVDDYETLIGDSTRFQVRIANAPINPPFVGPLLPSTPPGILRCLPGNPDPTEYADFLDEALCAIHFPANPDSDNNGVPDVCEYTDCDGNGTPDLFDPDCDQDGIPDACELDCNGDGMPDPCDCDCNGVLDHLDPDCDGDGIPDACEPDCDGDGVPDDCEPDCDLDGIPDDCEIDCDGDGIPNDCDTEPDCDGDGIPDNCEPDCDEDGIPDDCDADRDGDGIPDVVDPLIGPCSGKLYDGPILPAGQGGSGCGSGVIGD